MESDPEAEDLLAATTPVEDSGQATTNSTRMSIATLLGPVTMVIYFIADREIIWCLIFFPTHI